MELVTRHNPGCGLFSHPHIQHKRVEVVGVIPVDKTGAFQRHIVPVGNFWIEQILRCRHNGIPHKLERKIGIAAAIFTESESHLGKKFDQLLNLKQSLKRAMQQVVHLSAADG